MDVEVGCKSLSTLCQGCLSADRKLNCITGHNKTLFTKLRGDDKQSDVLTNNLLLCWECNANLNKMKHFQARIKTAQYRLLDYVNKFYNKKEFPLTLSTIIKTKHKEDFDYNFLYEDEIKTVISKQNTQRLEQKHLTEEYKDQTEKQTSLRKVNKNIIDEKEIIENENLLQKIKLENNEPIKEEYDNISVNNDNDYYETDFKIENNDLVIIPQKQNNTNIKKQLLKYEKYATITRKHDLFSENVSLYSENVFLGVKEMEDVLERDRKRVGSSKLPFKCKICKLGYQRHLDLLRHKTFQHKKAELPTYCLACKREILSTLDMEQHWKSYHSVMLRCFLCPELCRSKGEMRKHLNRAHTKVYSCNDCTMEYRTLREFSNHYKKAHERVVCDYCKKSMNSKRRLEKHIIRKHLPAHCSICDRTYRTHHGLDNHTKTFHPELVSCEIRKELCYCVECDKQFPSIYKYKRHLQQSVRHTPRKKVRVPCPDCGKIFTKNTYMNNHYRLVHLKESKHYCELCNKYFANGYGVRKHIQYVHQKIPMPKDKICDLCGRGFSTNRILINHRRTHTGERPFKCQYCPATFAQETAMKSHQKTQHKNMLCS